jgi:hypothetical protein
VLDWPPTRSTESCIRNVLGKTSNQRGSFRPGRPFVYFRQDSQPHLLHYVAVALHFGAHPQPHLDYFAPVHFLALLRLIAAFSATAMFS